MGLGREQLIIFRDRLFKSASSAPVFSSHKNSQKHPSDTGQGSS